MKYKKKGFLAAVLASCMLMLTGCGDDWNLNDTRVVFTTGLGKEDVFRIDDEVCSLPELMVYLTTTQNQYEQVYGSDIWNVSLDGVDLEENIKETVLAEVAQIKSMYLLAEKKEITLTDTEEQLVAKAAQEYFFSLNATEQELLGVNQEIIARMYREYLLANKVYHHIIADVNPEISDDEARRITVQHIWMRDYLEDGEGNRIPLSDRERLELYEDAVEVREMAAEGVQDFEQLASKYSDGDTITITFGKGELETALEDVAFQLATGEVSQVIETEQGFYIIKCLSTLDRAETDQNKLKIVEQRRNEAFGKEYDTFVASLARKLNQKLWDSIQLIRDENVSTSDFFVIYNKYLAENAQ